MATGTKITLLQIPLEPQHIAEKMNTDAREDRQRRLAAGEAYVPDPEAIESTKFVPHVAGASCQCAGVTFLGGSNPAAGRYLLDIVVLEPTDGSDGSD